MLLDLLWQHGEGLKPAYCSRKIVLILAFSFQKSKNFDASATLKANILLQDLQCKDFFKISTV